MSSAAKYRCELEELGFSHAANIMCQIEAYDDLMKDYSKTQERLKFRHAAEVEQLRRLSNFLKNNSERLSSTIKEIAATIRFRTLQNNIQDSRLGRGLVISD